MAIQFELAGSQIDGARDYQEDAFLITHLTDAEGNPSALVIVADGMGGHAAGNVASNMAVQAFNKHVSANYPTDDPSKILEECVRKANASIQETVKETPALAGMGCTLVAAILEGNKLWWASVGDSHVYLIRDRELIKKNADHSYGGFLDRMAAAGTPVEAEEGLSRNMLMSAITGDEINEIDVPSEPFELQAGDRLLICSDGMDTLSAGKIIQYSEWSDATKECADALMTAVEDAGMPRQDNTTAVVVNIIDKVEGEVAAAAPEPESAVEEIDLDKTYDEIKPDITSPQGQETQAAETTPQADTAPPPSEEKKSNTGMIIGIAAVVIIGIAVGVFMMMGGESDTPAPVSSTPDSSADIIEDEPDIDAEPPEPDILEPDEPIVVDAEETEAAPAPVAAATDNARDKLKDGSDGPEMVVIPGGTFDMGSPGSSRNADERPRHSVTVKRFAMSKYEISFTQYDQFAQATGRKLPDNLYMDRATHPAIYVSWDDAFYYVRWLSEQTGQKYRLPSEAEWEYVAGNGKRSPFWWGYDEEPNRAHCFGCGTGLDPRKPTKLGSFEPNPMGVYDMNGNVAEWAQDCWHDDYNGATTDGGVWEGGDCSFRIARGGAYSSPMQSIRHAKRDKYKSDQAYDHIGIRVVKDLD